MTTITGIHFGRGWTGHYIENACPCLQQPCGLIDGADADPDCPHHAPSAMKTMRQGHYAEDCPAPTPTIAEPKRLDDPRERDPRANEARAQIATSEEITA